MSTDGPSDIELLHSMLTGSEEALAMLYRRRHLGVYRFALQMCGSPAVAEDVTQEVFIALMRNGAGFDPGRGSSLQSFLLGIARNQVLRRLERERFYAPIEEAQDADTASSMVAPQDPAKDALRSETVAAVRRAVLSLPPRYREVVVLCDLQECSYQEAATLLECAVGTVRSRLHRARGLLLEKLTVVRAEPDAGPELDSARCFA